MGIDSALLKKIARKAEDGHHPFGPSSLAGHLKCSGKLAAEIDKPKKSNVYADVGTFAHDTLADCLLNELSAHDKIDTVSKCGRFTWTEEDAEFGQQYLDLVRGLVHEDGELYVETSLSLDNVIPGCHGIVDALILNFEVREIIVVDLKWGQGVAVSAINNSQLLAYLLAALDEYGLIDDFETFTGIICQPRKHSTTEETVSRARLETFRETIKWAWETSTQEDAPRTPGEDQCRWCKAADECGALAQSVLDDFDEFSPTESLSNTQIAQVLPRLENIENWIEKIRARAIAELTEGRDIPGYKLVEGRKGNRVWDDEEIVEAIMKRHRIPAKEMYTRKLLTPTQAKKTLTESRYASLEDHIVQKEGKPTLAPLSDKRPALNEDYADDFNETEK